VNIEEFPTGVRLTATDSYWLAMCWVPITPIGPDDEPPTEPALMAEPMSIVTINDDEHRIRDLFRHVAKVTKKADALDVPVTLDLETSTYDEDVPTLDPSLAAIRAKVEIPGEQISARTCEIPYPDWRHLLAQFDGKAHGKPTTTFSGWMLDRFAKVTKIIDTGTITLDWLPGDRGRWSIASTVPLACSPRGVFMHASTRRDAFADDDEERRRHLIPGALTSGGHAVPERRGKRPTEPVVTAGRARHPASQEQRPTCRVAGFDTR
jgi:hypothetical protein